MVERLRVCVFFRLVFPLLLLMGVAMPAVAGSKTWAYVSIADEHRIAVYAQDAETGLLEYLSDVKLTGTPGSQCTDPGKEYLYAAIRSTESIAVLKIDRETGGLSHVETVPAALNQTYLATDKSGKYLLGASYSGGKIAVYRITAEGKVIGEPLQVIPTAINAHSILLDATNRFAFVPHTGPNAIFQFQFDSESGRLTPQSPPKVTTPPHTGPRHLKFHPRLRMAYVANEQGSSASVYRLNDAGSLEHLQTLSTLPAGFEGENTCAEVKIHPNGKWTYVSNRGHDSLACYSIDETTGNLSHFGNVPTEKTPRSFDISTDGRYLTAAGQDNGKIAVYTISPESGELTRVQTVEVGGNLAWISLLSFE